MEENYPTPVLPGSHILNGLQTNKYKSETLMRKLETLMRHLKTLMRNLETLMRDFEIRRYKAEFKRLRTVSKIQPQNQLKGL